MGPTLSIRRPTEPPALPVARLHGRGPGIERAQRTLAIGIAIALAWVLPAIALGLTIALAA